MIPEAIQLLKHEPVSTVVNADGSITDTYGLSGVTCTTTFPANGSIVETFSAPISKTRNTTFDSNGNPSQTLS